MKSYRITESFYLNELPIVLPKVEYQLKPKHQYIIIDRSGSMWGDLNGIVDSIIRYVEKLPEGSSVSLGYFSGTSEYNLSVPYEIKKELDGAIKTINTYRSAMGMTCFTEILDKIKSNCQSNSSLFFFTDGCHNCGPFSKVIEILKNMKELLDISIFVGCGWINRQNMIDMAQTTEGSFIQLNGFQEFEETLNSFGECVGESIPGCIVTLPEDADNICSILGKNVINYIKDENNEVFYKASNKNKQVIYFTTSTLQGELTEFGKDERAARAMIHNLIQTNKTPKALQLLDKLGDKYYIRKLYNTFTEEEYAEVENQILKSIFDSRKRYKEGQVKGYLPKENAFCVLDALDIISNDDKAILHLNDPEFIYNKTTRKYEQTDGSKLEYPKDIKAYANNLKYHESRLNVNLNVNYQANVPLNIKEFHKFDNKENLNEEFKKYEIKDGEKYPVNCIRNYNIILDGKLNTKKLVLSGLSKDSINKLAENLERRDDGKYILDLTNLTLINKSYLTNTSAKILAEEAWKAFLLSNELSVLKYLKKTLTSSEEAGEELSKLDYLAENFYIKNGTYQPPAEVVESTDEYMSYEFNISFKGYSKASASSVIKKILSDGKITDREKIIEYYYNKYKNDKLENIESHIIEINKEYKKLQTKIQHSKFAIILINRGCMDEFTNRENMNLDIDISQYGLHIDKINTQFKVIQKPVKMV